MSVGPHGNDPQRADALAGGPQSLEAGPGDTAVVANPWRSLSRFTNARIGLGRAGISLPTAAQLDFQLAHAQARDAVHRPLEVAALCGEIEALGLRPLPLHSAAATRAVYLQRPDLGRRLDEASQQQLAALSGQGDTDAFDLVFAVVDGLSALAVQRHAVPLLTETLALLVQPPGGAAPRWTIGPVAVVEQGRVAIGDAIGEGLAARIVVVLIGERPGLSSPDSLGIYLTWAPRPGRSDAERNCISNVRPEGLGYRDAATKLLYLLEAARARRLTGIALKDESGSDAAVSTGQPNFLLNEPPGARSEESR